MEGLFRDKVMIKLELRFDGDLYENMMNDFHAIAGNSYLKHHLDVWKTETFGRLDRQLTILNTWFDKLNIKMKKLELNFFKSVRDRITNLREEIGMVSKNGLYIQPNSSTNLIYGF